MALPQPLETGSAALSEPGLVTYKTITQQDRETMLAYAEEHPRATLQVIADIFGVSKSTVKRTLEYMRGKRWATAAQLGHGHKEAVPNNVATVSHCPADMRGGGFLPDDPSCALSAVHSDEQGFYGAVASVSSQSLACESQNSDVSFFAMSPSATTSLSFRQQNFDHHASAAGHNSQASQSTAVPEFSSWRPDNPATVPCHLEGGSVVPPQMSVPPAGRSTMEIVNAPHPPRDRSSCLPRTQEHRIRPDEALEALQDVIEYCMRQPREFLDLREGVLLGKLLQKLDSLACYRQC